MASSLEFAQDGRLFYTEVFGGQVRVVTAAGTLLSQPFAAPSDVFIMSFECGMPGLALSPTFTTDGFVYVMYSVDNAGVREQVVVRYTDSSNVGTAPVEIARLPGVSICGHLGGRIAFADDGNLLVTVGDLTNTALPQDLSSLAGKILRYTPSGAVPGDNPDSSSPVYAHGVRNPFGLAIRPGTGQIFFTDNGPNNDDEINIAVSGGDFGWPGVAGPGGGPGTIDPIWSSGSTQLAPTGATFYTGTDVPALTGELLFCAFNDGNLYRVPLAGDVASPPVALGQQCNLDVTTGTDGALYFSSNDTIFRWGL